MHVSIELSNEIVKAILSRIDEAIHVVDIEGRTIFYNEVAAKHDGLTIAEVIGKPILEIFPSLNDSTSTLIQVMETRMPIYNAAQRYQNIHGKIIETVNTTLPIFVESKLVGAMEIAKDYSKMKLMSEQLVDLQKKMNKNNSGQMKARSSKYTFEDLISVTPEFIAIKEEAVRLAKSHSPILVYGESGTGKELFIQGVHHASPRASSPFIAQNCAAIPETLLDSLLFGTVRGGYTDAVDRPGLFELANGGTLFLDELHAMPIELQAKLLRVLEDGIVRRVGGTKDIVVDVRVVAAMNIHPQEAMGSKLLRIDLFYRLNVLSFEIMPLRRRRKDILYLANIFVVRNNSLLSKQVNRLDVDLQNFFLEYQWPGNVRELKHTIEYMMNICDGNCLMMDHLPMMLKVFHQSNHNQTNSEHALPFRKRIEVIERQLIVEALEQTNGNILQTAKILQLPRQTLQYKLMKYNIQAAE